jgi:hypothetical protein
MTPDQILGLSAFLAGMAVGCLVQWACLESDRRAKLRNRFRSPPFTTVGAGRRE